MSKLPPYHPYPALNASEYAEKIKELFDRYDWQIHLAQLNILASHDTARLLTVVEDDVDTVKLANLLLFTFPGAPSIYYGDEVGLVGGIDPDSRRSFPEKEKWNQDIYAYHKKLIELRKQHPALRRGDYQVLFADDNVYLFSRSYEGETIVIALNNDTESAQVKLDASKYNLEIKEVLFGDNTFTTEETEDGTNLVIQLQPRSGVMLK